MSNRIEKLKGIISRPQKIVITTHRGPDGDAIGSSLALYNFLLKVFLSSFLPIKNFSYFEKTIFVFWSILENFIIFK